MFWIVIVVIIAAIAVITLLQRPLLPARQPRSLSSGRTLFNLQIGDIVQYEGADWVVEDRLTYNDSGYTWLEYLLQDGDQQRWLSVEDDDRIEVCWMESANQLDISGTPPQQITVNQVTYAQTEAGTAKMKREGTTLNRKSQTCRYFDYADPTGKVLSIEDWQGDIEITQGREIRPSDLRLLPGDGRHVYKDDSL